MKLIKICHLVVTFNLALISLSARAIDNAAILLYHHVSSTTPRSTSISVEDFRRHMQYLKQHHVVLPLPEIIQKLQNRLPLPDKAVAITFDDGYDDILNNAHPVLQEYGFSYTIFINPDMVGVGRDHLDWQQIKGMQNDKVLFANHGEQHLHYLQKQSSEDQQQWLNRVSNNIQRAESILTDKLGYSLKYFAYPYGEFNLTLKQHLTELGYIGFGQHSGAIASYSDFAALPRFPAAGNYANLKTLKVKLASLTLPVEHQLDPNPELGYAQSPTSLTLKVSTSDIRREQLVCYLSGKPLKARWDKDLFEVKIEETLPPPRSRINCTAPSIEQPPRYYWYSQPWFKPNKEGQWLN